MISCTKLQLPPEPLTKGLPPPHPRPLCPQLSLLNPPPNKIPGYATGTTHQYTCKKVNLYHFRR